MTINQKESGFNLITLAVIMIIVGVLVSAGLKALGPSVRMDIESSMRNQLAANMDAVKGYAAINLALPAMPISTALPSVIPHPVDANGSTIRYVKDNNLITPEAICQRSVTTITVRQCNDASCTVPTKTIPNVAFALINIGENRNSQIAASNIDGINPPINLDVHNFNNLGIDYDSTDSLVSTTQPFDDLISWVTLPELKALTKCESKGATDLQILNNTLPDVKLYTNNYDLCSSRTQAQCTACINNGATSGCVWNSTLLTCDNKVPSSLGCFNNTTTPGNWNVNILVNGGVPYNVADYLWCAANTNTTYPDGSIFVQSLINPITSPGAMPATCTPTWSGPSLNLYKTNITQTITGVEQPASLTINVKDNAGNQASRTFTFKLIAPTP